MRIRILIFVGISLIVLIVSLIIVRAYRASLFATSGERAHIGFWLGERAFMLSLSRAEDVNYIVPLSVEDAYDIPGGYGKYRVGSWAKLAQLEKDEDIYKKAFSGATQTLVPYYLAEKEGKIYHEDTAKGIDGYKNLVYHALFYASGNLQFFDRLWILLRLQGLDDRFLSIYTTSGGEEGIFFDKACRNEKKLVQFFSTNNVYSLSKLSSIIEGYGIRVADTTVDEKYKTSHKSCTIIEHIDANTPFSATTQRLAQFFSCKMDRGDSGFYDIRFVIDDATAKAWQ